jgi:hypothetical protein
MGVLPTLGLAGLLLISTWIALAAGPDQSDQSLKNLANCVPPEDRLSISCDVVREPSRAGPFALTQVFSEVTKLTAGDAQKDDIFGIFVSISGDTIVVGALFEDGGPGDPLVNAGAAYVFERNEGGADNWGEVAKLTASDAQVSDDFGRSVSISGDTIVVGAGEEDGGPGDPLAGAGAAYVFERNEGGANNWGEVAKLTASDAQDEDSFGESVSISGDTIVVGARGEAGGPGDPLAGAGAAYVFERNQGGADNWGEVAKLTASDAQVDNGFGAGISISGDTVVIGAVGENAGSGDPLVFWAGAAYVFARNHGGANNWGEVTKLTASDAQADDRFGSSVSVSGNTIVVGAVGEDGGPGDPLDGAGAAYVFGRDQGGASNWGEVAKLAASDAGGFDAFGVSVSIGGDTIVIGASGEDGGPGDPLAYSGAAYVFGRDRGGASNWGEVAKLTADDAQDYAYFGYRVSISGDTIVAGATGEDSGPGDQSAGAAYIFAPLVLDNFVYLPLVIGQ